MNSEFNTNSNISIPKLRFPEFSTRWSSLEFSEAVYLRKERFDPSKSSNSRVCIELENIEKESGRLLSTYNTDILKSIKNVFHINDVLYSKLRPYLRKFYQPNFKGVCTSEIWVFNGKKVINSFLFYFIQGNRFNYYTNISTGSRMPRADWSLVSIIQIKFPGYEEQQKIASFLESVDSWINNLKNQKESLEEYKKGMMQKIFAQEIRFKDENGTDFPKWEERRLGEVSSINKGEQLNKDRLLLEGNYPCQNGGVEPSGFTNSFNTKANTITISEGGNSCGHINYQKTDFWAGGHCYSLLEIDTNVEKLFLFQNLKYNQNQIMKLRVGSGLPNIQKKDISKLKINLPSFPEQQKIASFLNSLDDQIQLKTQQIEKAEEWKKGLMQGLFV